MHGIEEPTPALHTDTTDPLHDSPGRQLRVARETAGVSLSDVAHELHLSTTTIAALEDDRYEGLPSEVFILGYLRAYARLLGLDPAPLLEQYRRLQPAGSQPVLPVEKPREDHGGSLALPLIVALVLLVLLAGGGWLAWTQLGGGAFFANLFAKPESTDGSSMPLGGRVPQPVLPRLPEGDEAASFAGAPDARAIDSRDEDSDAEGAAAARASSSEPARGERSPDREPRAGEPTDADGAPGAGDAEATVLGAPRGDEQGAAAGGTGVVGQGSADEGGADADAGDRTASAAAEVVMTFNGPCWVDVRDSTGEFKLFGEMNKGDREVLGGRAPYSIILGNATAVSVTVDGKPFDVQRVARGNVARFDLDPAAL